MFIKNTLLAFVLLFASAVLAVGQSGVINPYIKTLNDIPASAKAKLWGRWKASEIPVAGGAEFSVWPDISGNGRNLVQGSLATDPDKREGNAGLTGNRTAALFSNEAGEAEYLKLSVTPDFTDADIFFFLKSMDPSVSRGLMKFGNGGAQSYYPYNGLRIYESFAAESPAYIDSGFPTLNQWRNYNVSSAANDYQIRWDNVLYYTSATNAVKIPLVPVIGKNSGDGAGGDFCECRIAEIILMSPRATVSERAGIDAYFRREYLGL